MGHTRTIQFLFVVLVPSKIENFLQFAIITFHNFSGNRIAYLRQYVLTVCIMCFECTHQTKLNFVQRCFKPNFQVKPYFSFQFGQHHPNPQSIHIFPFFCCTSLLLCCTQQTDTIQNIACYSFITEISQCRTTTATEAIVQQVLNFYANTFTFSGFGYDVIIQIKIK